MNVNRRRELPPSNVINPSPEPFRSRAPGGLEELTARVRVVISDSALGLRASELLGGADSASAAVPRHGTLPRSTRHERREQTPHKRA
jgi:hypothetical protein